MTETKGKPTPQTPSTGGFDFNQPTIISLLYLGSFFTGLTGFIGVILAYVWKDQPNADWEVSHYQYLIRTFWIGVIGSIIGIILTVILIGVLVIIATAILVGVRSVLSLLAAQKREAMPNPDSWTI